ncbi:subtilase-type protease inhibitor [Streptomyces sp. NBC_00237]|uniref:SSI family serine proteinase inhibitor n=1 Tax=Streptomyces sp. NBC_00237 TaxID=2975687 RepID=UPI0022572E9C|nr:SSI family serine proteinase inhibitor [Streptomyces sp. NBC_00237]MCX5203439.1 subtilase-type protease inhibitor [Streptomyces sp. NBC_00237]
MSAVRSAVRQTLVATAATAALLASAGGATAQQATAREAHPDNWMYLAVIQGEDVVSELSGTLLTCPPAKNSGHPNAKNACKQLAAVDGDIARIKRADVACPMIYKPVTAMAYGRWDGRRMVFAKNYPNACVMEASTGLVFTLAGQ